MRRGLPGQAISAVSRVKRRPFSLRQKRARAARRMRVSFRGEGAVRANPHPNPLPSLDKLGMRAERVQPRLIALGAGVRVGGRERDGRGGRRPAGQGHGDK